MNQSELWDRFKGGDMKGLEQIYFENIDLLFHFGKKICPDEEVVSDQIHDLFVYLWENRAGLGQAVVIRAYLLKSLRNRLIDHFRKQGRHKTVGDVSTVKTLSESREDELISFETEAYKNAQLSAAMGQLTARQREIIYLKYTKNLSYEEIAETLGINYQSVRNLAHRAITELRRHLSFDIAIITFLLINIIR
ncbi:MAG: sigma-70 family RNA polymerase sigma factor [Saprospiraceae bacterium]|nr:sigma-70 family RNA polymerase sigma factor [Saprospiraceae bacterium]